MSGAWSKTLRNLLLLVLTALIIEVLLTFGTQKYQFPVS